MMKRKGLLGFGVIVLTLILVFYLTSHVGYPHTANGPAGVADRSISCEPNNECGIQSLWIASLRLGIPIEYKVLFSEMTVGQHGTTFGEIMDAAKRHSLESRLTTATWKSLLDARTTAILWVDGNHFLLVDARETKNEEGLQSVRTYDPLGPATWILQEDLGPRWRGETLFLFPLTSQTVGDAPAIRFDSLLQDAGWVEPSQDVTFEFPFVNAGHAALSVNVKGVGCGCVEATVDKKDLPPGSTGFITARMNATGLRGPYSSYVMLETNDPLNKFIHLRVAASVFMSYGISHRHLSLGEIKRGGTAQTEFYVYNRGGNSLRVHRVRALPEGLANRIGLEASWEELNRNAAPRNSDLPYPPRSGDYAVRLSFRPKSDAPIGNFSGTVVVDTNQSAPDRRSYLSFDGMISSQVEACPKAVVLSRRQPEAALRLVGAEEFEIKHIAHTLESDTLHIRFVSKEDSKIGGGVDYVVSLQEGFRAEHSISGTVRFLLGDSSEVVVPVLIVANENA